ncbi:hypothetical protein [Argonema antarcticum]|uniref:hypothetical protein n=1 Tax=Argonema antarcticum TaxID=2942763 RepID=UPI0020123CD8|nr:hypothetical protein [Argonema antarcticum]MCL1475035.1 hypothetical protein [Argonema antarcticum A004/B2]
MEHKILVRSHVGSDGILQIKVPTEFKDADLEVTVTIQPVTPAPKKTPEELGYAPGFFEEVVGGWVGEPLVREDQGEYETREELA